MTERAELFAEFAVVVDFAVEDDPDGTVLVRDRLLSAFEIDDGQAAMTERRITGGLRSARLLDLRFEFAHVSGERALGVPAQNEALVHQGDDH